MDKRFKNNYLAQNVGKLIDEQSNVRPTKGDVGGFSIDFTNEGDTISYESLIYLDEESRDADLELLTTLLK